MNSIVSFISNAVLEPADIKIMSDAYSRAMEEIFGFGRPNRIVAELIATRIIVLRERGDRDADQLCAKTLAACGFRQAWDWNEGT
jgi:hypothetical protein